MLETLRLRRATYRYKTRAGCAQVLIETPQPVLELPLARAPQCALWAQASANIVNSGVLMLRTSHPAARDAMTEWAQLMQRTPTSRLAQISRRADLSCSHIHIA